MIQIASMLTAVVLLATPMSAQEQAAGGKDPWAIVRVLEGVWEGNGVGFGKTSKVTHSWQFVLDEKFLRLEAKSVNQSPPGEVEMHEDVGYVSWSEGEGFFSFDSF